MTTKIVYYGPGLCGKTTNLNTIYGRTSQKARGEMVSLNTETDRTLFFDLLPMDVGMVGGFKSKLQLYTVPGQVFYNSTRKLVLKGVDGVVFVADSQTAMLDANKESFQNLRDNLRELGLDLKDIPLVFQWNKRDLKSIIPVDVLERELNPSGHTSFQSIASDGTGVFETLRGITKLALANIKALHMVDAAGAKAPAPTALHTPGFRDSGAPPEALSTLDLSHSRDLLGEEETSGGAGTAPAAPVQVMAPLHVKLSPAGGKGAPAVPKVHLKPPPLPVVPRPLALPAPVPMALPRVPQARPHPDLHLTLSPFALDGDMEVVVTVRQNGAEIGTATLHRPTPAWGASGALSVEIKRS
nr:GTPase domain-containing protein [Mesoterricola silvestris]